MSREAMEAVQDHSQIKDHVGRNIFIAIGRFVAADTKKGWCSDRTVAEIARCDKDTVGAWRERLVELGELETWTDGAGRGTKRWYRFLLPFNNPIGDSIIFENENGSQVYFIACGGRIKIGKANNPEQRLKDMQIGSPHKLYLIASVAGDEKLESKFHNFFSHLRESGEWFRFTEDIDNWLRDNIEEYIPILSLLYRDNNEGGQYQGLSQRVELLSQRVEEMSRQIELLSQMIVPNVPPRGGQEHPSTLETPLGTPQPPKGRARPESPPPEPEPAGSSGGRGSDFAEVVKAYENNIGGLTGMVSELIGDAVDTYPVDWIIDAIGIAVRNNSLKWNYVEGVLKKWQVHGRGYSPKANGRNGHHPNQVPAPSQGLVEIEPGVY